MERRQGTVTDGTDPDRPLVVIDGDSTAAPAWNMDSGYAPVAGDRVQLSVGGGVRLLTYGHAPGWRTTAPSPVFAAGVTVGGGTIDAIQWLLYRRAGTLRMDYRGRFLLGSTSAVTGAVTLTIPGGLVTPAGVVQSGGGDVTFFDGVNPSTAGWWAAGAAASAVSLRVLPSGLLDASTPFVWASAMSIRWDISGLEVEAA